MKLHRTWFCFLTSLISVEAANLHQSRQLTDEEDEGGIEAVPVAAWVCFGVGIVLVPLAIICLAKFLES